MDYSFIRFIDNFDKAKDLGNSKLTEFDYDMQIHLKPGEVYTCISNNSGGISFGGVYKAYLVNCNDDILADITSKVYIEEFIDDAYGLPQIKLEMVGVTNDFYGKLVYLRLDHNIVAGKKYWSNPFLHSNYDIDETARFRFKNYIDLDGTNYNNATIFQSIRLKCYKTKNNYTSSSQSYTSFKGNKLSSRVIKTKQYDFVFDMCNDFIYDRLMYLLVHDVIYVDNVRVTDKQTFDSQDRFAGSNVSQEKFKLSVDETDIDDNANQIYNAPIPKPPVVAVDYNSNDYHYPDYYASI